MSHKNCLPVTFGPTHPSLIDRGVWQDVVKDSFRGARRKSEAQWTVRRFRKVGISDVSVGVFLLPGGTAGLQERSIELEPVTDYVTAQFLMVAGGESTTVI